MYRLLALATCVFARVVDYPAIPFKVEAATPEQVQIQPSQIQFTKSNLNGTEKPEQKISYSGSQLWKTAIDDQAKIKVLTQLRDDGDVSMWGGNATNLDILIKPSSIQKVEETLKKENIKYEITIQDLQRAIDAENPSIDDIELDDRKAKKIPFRDVLAWRGLSSLGNKLEYRPFANWGHRLTWQAYHRLSDIHGYLDYLAETYPDLCSVQTIGRSVQGRPIRLLKISNRDPTNKAVWVDGGIHAREWISPATVTYIIDQLVANFESESSQVRNIDWYISPVLNPDGYEYTHTTDRLWRKNRGRSGFCAGTDLNRNFGHRWGGRGASKNPCAETYGGSGPFSEPESAAIQSFIIGNGAAKWKAYVSFHSYGQYVLFPWGYDRVVPPDYKDLESVGRKIATAIRSVGGPSYTVGPAANTLYPAAGGSDDWAKGQAGFKYAYTIELRDNGQYGFVLPANYIKPTANEAFAAIQVIAEAAAAA